MLGMGVSTLPSIRGFKVSEDEIADLLAFLESLTDQSFLTDPAIGPPRD